MTETRRRSVLTAFAGAALGTGLAGGQAVAAPRATASTTAACPTVPVIPATGRNPFATNTDLYRHPQYEEGTAYARRYKRQARTDADLGAAHPFTRTTVLALHGGGIEPGTSEIALGIAGYNPADLTPVTPVPPNNWSTHDYWMFEGLLGSGNSAMHITSTRCDDLVALSMAGGSANVISVHGCDVDDLKPVPPGPGTPGRPGIANPAADSVLVGGLSTVFKGYLREELGLAGFTTYDGDDVPSLAGTDPDNPCNRGLLRAGAQLELTNGLRRSMFGDFSRAGRPGSTTDVFRRFVPACRKAIHRMEQRTDQAHY
ncbi:poly-gamma-glutamate hydrolase family protein [Streptomyces sp. NPDC014894]|uniref:poly-gamma-glutamate hydrolase family protein n=1 Tax=Streptomyces sp. NPDC014894 TaxID=3364931 RepID=UPI0036FADF9D